uniref:Uncharacterized protein n=1 Tax=Anopheles christyi TaxID=43041 RepID=A0A182KAQ2_9DIPT
MVAEDEKACKQIEIAVQRHRKMLHYVTKKCVPLLEDKLREADEKTLEWKERALKAEGKLALLERQLAEKTSQSNEYKKLSRREGSFKTITP